MKGNLLLIVFSLLCITSVSNAVNIIYVDVDGPNEPGGGTIDNPFRKIQDAIGTAIDGDIIEVRPGIYTGEGNYDLNPGGKSITIRSINPEDPNITANTVIDPNGAGRGIYFVSGEDPNCIVSGFTIRNGYAADDSGGAIVCFESSPTVSNCIIKNNVADWYGGAVFCPSGSPEITGCRISGNSAQDGGGLEFWSGTCQLTNCIISNNDASGNGGGIDCYWEGQAQLNNCTVVGNSASSGGGLHCVDDGKATIRNSIFWANEAASGQQIGLDIAGSASINYSDVQDGWPGTDNIDADPYFVSFEANGNPDFWDFHLQSAYGRWNPESLSWVSDPNTSPCIDAGDPNSDWASEPWPNGKRINMGAYGRTNQASKNGNPADFDVNGVVNFVDFAKFSFKWFAEEYCIEDLTGNGQVDIVDFVLVAENWFWQSQ
jgi:hypothetical protein